MKSSRKTKKILLSILTASLVFSCANNAYAEIHEIPKKDGIYNDKVVLNSEWQISQDGKYTFNKGLTISPNPNASSKGNAIFISPNVDLNFELGSGSEMNLQSTGGPLCINSSSKLTINGDNSNLYFANTKCDEYNEAATIKMDEGSKLEINAGSLTTTGGAETNLQLFDNAQAKINLKGDFISNAGGTAIAMRNYNIDANNTSLSIHAANITLETTNLEDDDRKVALDLLDYNGEGNKFSVDLQATDTLKISGVNVRYYGDEPRGSTSINLKGKDIIISGELKCERLSKTEYSGEYNTTSTLNAVADNISISGSQFAIYSDCRTNANLTAKKNVNLSGSTVGILSANNADTKIRADNITVSDSHRVAVYSCNGSYTDLYANKTLKLLCANKWVNPFYNLGIACFNGSTVNAQAEEAINIKGKVCSANGKIFIGKDSDTLQTTIEGELYIKDHGYIKAYVCNAGSSLNGNISDWSWRSDVAGTGIHLVLNNGSVWKNINGDSCITSLDTSNAKIDMHDDYFLDLNIGTLTGDKTTFNMDIDAGTNEDNSDRIIIAGTHTGEHYITLNNVNSDGNTDGAAGTVLVSVTDEQGKFLANDKESSLYWYKYTLDRQDVNTGIPEPEPTAEYKYTLNHQDHQDITSDGHRTDWYLKKVELLPKPTTSADAVDATQRLAFANWVEDDKLMQRMGDLRHETNNEEGVWVRVKGGKYSGDGFSNRHTMYQLGYDDVVKNTDKLKRYQGVAFSYDDGKNSFNRGSGKLKAKSIGFYSTDLRNKGHYLDLAFKIYDADSDFTVFDTAGKKITGAFDNTGISLSAEYGRKKQLDEHWSIEPQAQLTLGYLGGARYTTSNGIHVNQSDPNSVLGRVGCNFIYNMDEKNTVYAKANWLHQFAGNYGATLTNGTESLRIDNNDHDTWFEYGLGFACMTGKNNHLYADVERSTGGSLRKDWQWNAGMFWTF